MLHRNFKTNLILQPPTLFENELETTGSDSVSNGSEWETQSEEEIIPGAQKKVFGPVCDHNGGAHDITMELPVVKDDVPRLTEIPVSHLAESRCMSWFKSVLTYRNNNKAYERIIVSFY